MNDRYGYKLIEHQNMDNQIYCSYSNLSIDAEMCSEMVISSLMEESNSFKDPSKLAFACESFTFFITNVLTLANYIDTNLAFSINSSFSLKFSNIIILCPSNSLTLATKTPI